jgi:hypothetical protein
LNEAYHVLEGNLWMAGQYLGEKVKNQTASIFLFFAWDSREWGKMSKE